MSEQGKTLEARVYNVNLSRVYWGRKSNRADRAVRLIKEFVARHTKANRVILSNEVNEYTWRSREKPARRISILVKVVEKTGEEGEEKIREAIVHLASKKLKPGKVEPAAKE